MVGYIVVFCVAVAGVLGGIPRTHISPKIDWKIVGGSNAPAGEYKYQVSLVYLGSTHVCGGAIINNEYIITAAHCVAGIPLTSLTVRVGTNRLSTGGKKYALREIHYHEDFDIQTIKNDVAVIRVEPMTFTKNIQPIAVEKDYVEGNENVTLTGWGATSYPGQLPDYLQHINLTTLNLDDCKSKHDAPAVGDKEICTFTKVGEGACQGDSGGPLVRSINGERKLVGIVSWGWPCAIGFPDVYSRVSSYIDWFNDKCNNCLE